MARRVTWGTPFRSLHYIFPRGKWAFLVPSLLAGGGLLVLLLAFHLIGWRNPVSPGPVIGPHSNFESRCEECHKPRHGASNIRCQRCHDPGGAGRLSNNAHVFFGSADAAKASAAPHLDCAKCHVDHRGRNADLAAVDPVQCASCHDFRRLSKHPEFAVLRNQSREAPGILFTHDRHVKEALKETGGVAKDTCVTCHEAQAPGKEGSRTADLQRIEFDKHCASCHVKDDSVGRIDPITLEDVVGPADLQGQGLGSFDASEFEIGRGRISKTTVAHKDEWVLMNLRKLRREAFGESWAAERGALLARQNQLERRLAQAAPLARQDLEGLQARQTAALSEMKGLEARLAAQASAPGLAAGLKRVEDVAAAATAAGDPAAAAELRARLASLNATGLLPAALPGAEYDARRRELLVALEAIEGVDPGLKLRAADLRRRLAALRPGDTGTEILTRAKDQRQADLARVADEITLRESGLASPSTVLLAAEQRSIRDALKEVRARLALLSEGPEPKAKVTAGERERKKESIDVLVAPCSKCHIFKEGAFTRVAPARPVLVRSTFVHGPHLLQAECSRCHAGVELSKKSSDLNFKGVASCQECHAPGRTREDCASCHKYHPPVSP